MTHLRRPLGIASIVFALIAAGALQAAAPAGTDLWGGPAAKGIGTNARFDTNIYVSSVGAASGSIDFLLGGATLASVPFTVSTRGVAVVAAPAAVDGMGAFFYHVRSDASVNAWSETYNDTPAGRYGTVSTAFPVSDFLIPGDEAWGGGADASSSVAAGRARTNVGVLCSPLSTQGCTVEVVAFDAGSPAGVGQVFTIPGSVGQQSLAALLPCSAEKSKLALRFRMLTGAGLPYAIKNDNVTSDGSNLSLSVSRGAFSTAPVIASFTISPSSGCSPLTVTATWSTTGADHVNITGAAGDLTTSGTATFTVVSGRDGHVLAKNHAPGARESAHADALDSDCGDEAGRDRLDPCGLYGNARDDHVRQARLHGLDVHRERQPVHVHGRLRHRYRRRAPHRARRRLRARDGHVHGHRHRARRSGDHLLHGGSGARLRLIDDPHPQLADREHFTGHDQPRHRALRPRAERLGRLDDHRHDDVHAERLLAPQRHGRPAVDHRSGRHAGVHPAPDAEQRQRADELGLPLRHGDGRPRPHAPALPPPAESERRPVREHGHAGPVRLPARPVPRPRHRPDLLYERLRFFLRRVPRDRQLKRVN